MRPTPSFLLAALAVLGAAYSVRAQPVSVETDAGREIWDKDGLVGRTNKSQIATYNRELLNLQRRMNQNPPPGAPKIPETGRYNYEMFQHGALRLKNQADEHDKGLRADRAIGLAALMDKQFSSSSWIHDPAVQSDLIRAAKAKSLYDAMEARLERRKSYLEGAKAAVLRYEDDLKRLKTAAMITDAQADAMTQDEAYASRWLSLTLLETQAFHARGMRERLDPTSPDSRVVTQLLDDSRMTADQKERYKEQGRALRGRLEDLARVLETTRKSLQDGESADTARAAISSAQTDLGGLSDEYRKMLEEIVAKTKR